MGRKKKRNKRTLKLPPGSNINKTNAFFNPDDFSPCFQSRVFWNYNQIFLGNHIEPWSVYLIFKFVREEIHPEKQKINSNWLKIKKD